MAVSLGMIVRLYPEAAERARAIAVFSFTGAAGASVGTVAGGVLTEAAGWRTIFLVNVPIGAAILLAAVRRLPAERGIGLRAGLDLPGALLATAGLMVAVLGIVGNAEHGWASPARSVRRRSRRCCSPGSRCANVWRRPRWCRPGCCASRAWSPRTPCSSSWSARTSGSSSCSPWSCNWCSGWTRRHRLGLPAHPGR